MKIPTKKPTQRQLSKIREMMTWGEIHSHSKTVLIELVELGYADGPIPCRATDHDLTEVLAGVRTEMERGWYEPAPSRAVYWGQLELRRQWRLLELRLRPLWRLTAKGLEIGTMLEAGKR